MAKVSIVSWNVQGLNSAVKRSLGFNCPIRFTPLICIRQETRFLDSQVLGLNRAWVGSYYHATYSSYSTGVSVLVHRLLPFQLLSIRTNPDGRYIVMHVLIADYPLIQVGLHLPPLVDVSLLATVLQIVLDYDIKDLLLMGDFNLTLSGSGQIAFLLVYKFCRVFTSLTL